MTFWKLAVPLSVDRESAYSGGCLDQAICSHRSKRSAKVAASLPGYGSRASYWNVALL